MKIDLLLLPRGQNPLSYYILYNESKHNILALVGKANKWVVTRVRPFLERATDTHQLSVQVHIPTSYTLQFFESMKKSKNRPENRWFFHGFIYFQCSVGESVQEDSICVKFQT
jgi:hypothetical protein